MKQGQLLGVLIFAGLICGLLWLTAQIYIMALHIPLSLAGFIHTCIILFCILFVFSWFSATLNWNIHHRHLYRFCNILFGIFFYLFIGSVLLSITSFFSSSQSLALEIVILAFCAGIIGLLQARYISITSYEVSLPNFPNSWKGKRMVFLSDTHFGIMNNTPFSKKVIKHILALAPDLVLHAGDFYDGPAIPLGQITAQWKELTDKVPLFYTSGNHELYGNYAQFVDSVRTAGATVLLNDKVIHDGVQIAGITYLAKGQGKIAAEVLKKLDLDPRLPTILINHPPTFHTSANERGISLMLSGHTHRGQFWPLGYITWLIYGKFNYGLHRVGNLTAITSRGVGTAGPPLRLFNSPEIVVIEFR